MIAGRYTLVEEVGRGGMGVVWRGVDQVLDREVALKRVGMMPGGVSPDLARAEREARLAASLNHPNVVAVFDLVTEGAEQWLVMEYVENRTLAELVRERGPLTPDQAAELLEQAASALAAAHRAGIVHRDVKPSNILVTSEGRVKLSDFGIARAHADVTLTQTGLMSGSPAYLSPEVASGGSATAASDVWALGATLFHALTGRPPFEVGSNVMGALYQIVHADPPRPPNAGWLLPLLESTMTKDPGDRWPMAEVRDFLAAGAPSLAPPPADDDEPTTLLTAAAPAPAPAEPALAAPVEPLPGREPESEGGSSGRWLLPLLLVGALALLVGLGWWAFSPGDGERPVPSAGDPQTGASSGPASPSASPPASSSTSPSASEEPAPSASGAATDSPESEETQDGDQEGDQDSGDAEEEASPSQGVGEPRATAAAMTGFVGDYFATVTADPDTSWTWLTPEFQNAVGRANYEGFWAGIDSAQVADVTADPENMTVSYTITYTRNDGTMSTENKSAELVLQGDRYLIAGES